MSRLGKYCKAYLIDDLRKFSGWNEAAREEQAQGANGTESTDAPGLGSALFVQEDYTVTGGIFLDEHVVLERPTPEWIEFCRDTLKFAPPAESSAAA